MKKRSYELLIANRKYKDTIFRWIFSQIENLLSLYNAVTGKHYQNPEELEIVTLENAIYMGMKNDLAFVLEMGLYLYEHQSTYNPNIPLRDLFYIASEYQKLVDEKSLYSSGIQKIPTPNFLVFYNGTDRDVPAKSAVVVITNTLHGCNFTHHATQVGADDLPDSYDQNYSVLKPHTKQWQQNWKD